MAVVERRRRWWHCGKYDGKKEDLNGSTKSICIDDGKGLVGEEGTQCVCECK